MRLNEKILPLLRCPKCLGELERHADEFKCLRVNCGKAFPLIDGIPVLVDESASVFSISNLVEAVHQSGMRVGVAKKLKQKLLCFIPNISRNIKGRKNYLRLVDLLSACSASSTVLVLGGRVLGQGMEPLVVCPSLMLVETDIQWGPRTALICDAHKIPFPDRTFDAVIAQAVLEYVVDPYQCVGEIHRVLKKDGIVYAETPFMQQVHGGRYDFTRFSHLGHRRLFRRFEEVESGAVCGPGMAMAWSYQYFLLSFVRSKILRALARLFARLTSFYWKYFDYFLIDKPGALDAASGYYFMGKKSDQILSDKELIQQYRGLIS